MANFSGLKVTVYTYYLLILFLVVITIKVELFDTPAQERTSCATLFYLLLLLIGKHVASEYQMKVVYCVSSVAQFDLKRH